MSGPYGSGRQVSGVSWSGCWREQRSRPGVPVAVGVSGQVPGARAAIQGRRLSTPNWRSGGKRAGWSRLPRVTSRCGASSKQKPSGVPQAAQNGRAAAGEERNQAG